MKKGTIAYSKLNSTIWDLTKGEKLNILSEPKFGNGEYQIKTNKGWVPTVFLTENC